MIPAQGTLRPQRPSRAIVVAELLSVFVAAHFAYRAFRRFTPLGQAEMERGLNFSMGVLLALISLAAIRWTRCYPPVSAERPRSGPSESIMLGAGLLALALLFGGLTIPLGIRTGGSQMRWFDGVILSLLGLAASTVFFFALARRPQWGKATRLKLCLASLLAVIFFLGPFVVAEWTAGDARSVGLDLISKALFAAVGEELFFRGYVQSRGNQAFGRPWRFFGVRFGPGLVIATVLFAVIHALNGYDYFEGAGKIGWGAGLGTLAVTYAFLRERTGGILASMVYHSLLNAAGVLMRVM